jgi:hypothetical protein
VHPSLSHLACIYHHIALLDSTYKTNQYQLHLLPIIGQSASNQLFLIAFCFLACKDIESYIWVVDHLKKNIWRPQHIPKVFITNRDSALRGALAEVFPDSQANLCTWHLNKNLVTNCKKFFPASLDNEKTNPWKEFMLLWNQVTNAKTLKIYFEWLDVLKTHLASWPAVLEYLENLILPVKELFVVAWSCQYPHLQNLNTSFVQSGHTYIKNFIRISTGDFLLVFH